MTFVKTDAQTVLKYAMEVPAVNYVLLYSRLFVKKGGVLEDFFFKYQIPFRGWGAQWAPRCSMVNLTLNLFASFAKSLITSLVSEVHVGFRTLGPSNRKSFVDQYSLWNF